MRGGYVAKLNGSLRRPIGRGLALFLLLVFWLDVTLIILHPRNRAESNFEFRPSQHDACKQTVKAWEFSTTVSKDCLKNESGEAD